MEEAFKKPSLPWRYDDQDDDAPQQVSSLDLSDLTAHVSDSFQSREQAYESSRTMQAELVQIRTRMGLAAVELERFRATHSIAAQQADRTRRPANLSYLVEDYAQACAYQHFLDTGVLMAPPVWATDEEYLGGAVMGLAKELESYGMGRATVRDGESVQAACDLTRAIFDYLLQHDFRNGPLRRKFDRVKYSLRALETLLYELAVTSSSPEQQPAAKKLKRSLLPDDELKALQQRMEHRDALRETLIKRCRDGQKAAKQAIFALHRGDFPKALTLLDTCKRCIQEDLVPMVKEEPPLRSGSFANVVEEYVEARLLAVWFMGRYSSDADTTTVPMSLEEGKQQPAAILLGWKEFTTELGIELDPEEYMGGLSDLSGEVGRFAVQCGTARDVAGVKLCLVTNSTILREFQLMGRLPGKNGTNKMEAVRNSVHKMERMLYELSLSQAAGGRNVQTDVAVMQEEKD